MGIWDPNGHALTLTLGWPRRYVTLTMMVTAFYMELELGASIRINS